MLFDPGNDDLSVESSIDGDLNDFLRNQGIFKDSSQNIDDTNFLDGSFDQNISKIDSFENILSSCSKINSILNENGYYPVQFSSSDIDISNQSISVFLVDSWATSLLPGILEICERQSKFNNAVKGANITALKDEISIESLQKKISDLQQKLIDNEKNNQSIIQKNLLLIEENNKKAQDYKILEESTKKKVKQLEILVNENERRVRQKETELHRFKEKLISVVEKEKEQQSKHKQNLAKILNGNVSSSSKSKSKSSTMPLPLASNQIVESLLYERTQVKEYNKDLSKQITELSIDLKDFLNGSNTKKNSIDSSKSVNSEKNDSFAHEENILNPSASLNLNYQFEEQFKRIEYLNHRIQILQGQLSENESKLSEQKARSSDMLSEIENLRLELEARPTIRQFTLAQKEIKSLEEKLHDAIVLRNETNEIQSWKKHLSTRDRIKADRRNFELGLWLIDSLPKTIMKEALQNICRELNVSDISEIKPSLDKLKAVIKNVPRMERFISEVSSFVFTKSSRIDKERDHAIPVMEEVIPILKSWWAGLQKGLELDEFKRNIVAELIRRENLLKSVLPNYKNINDANIENFEIFSESLNFGKYSSLINKFSVIFNDEYLPKFKLSENIYEVLGEMVNFQIDIFKQKNKLTIIQN